MTPFSPGTGLPWNEPDFSRRVLKAHLCQDHDRASRRFEIIDQQVAWIHESLLGRQPGRILDLGCGPGLYTRRLAQRGHQCMGLDVSPASIQHAKAHADQAGEDCEYRQIDLRSAELGSGFDMVIMLFGEFNTLAPLEAAGLLHRVQAALSPSGRVLLELQYEDDIRALGENPCEWSTESEGIFAEDPYVLLHESQWHAAARVTTERYWVFPERTPARVYSLHTQAYSDATLEAVFEGAGLSITGRYESISPQRESDVDLFAVVGTRPTLSTKTS